MKTQNFMNRRPIITWLAGAPKLATTFLWQLFLVFAGVYAPAPTQAAPVAISIPGAVKVTIQPPEAVADGARWSLDGGAAQVSGASVTNLSADTHTVQFNNLAAWLEPDAASVLVVGGKQTEVTATYRPLPRFYFRAVPDQRIHTGATLEFVVHTDDPGDPQNPGPGASLQVSAAPAPVGVMSFDGASGRFAYTPVAADRLPFTVTFRTAQGLTGTVEITPLNARSPEDEVISYDRPLPDAESRDYMQITEIKNGQELFNDQTNETFNVSISGQTLVFAADHPAFLLAQYSGRFDLRELRLYADKVIIRSPLILAQTYVSIHARELRFEGDGRIETTPRPRLRRPAGAVWEDNLFFGNNGDPGHAGGDVDVFVERFFSDATTTTRFVMRGGDGGPAGDGRDGRNEGTVSFPGADWFKLMSRAGNPICGTTEFSGAMLYLETRFNGQVEDICGSRTATARGENAVRSGIPGPGGKGGTLRSTLNLSAQAQLTGGATGARAGDHIGGVLTARRFVYRVSSTVIDRFGNETVNNSDTTAPKASGQGATAPFGAGGAAGSVQVTTNAALWLHSFALRSIVQFAKDGYLNDRIAETRQLLGEYQALLLAHQRVVAPDEVLSDEEFSEKVNLDQLLAEVDVLLHRIDSNLDFFGNPAGWVPMLSFEANLAAFQNEVRESIPVLYLSYWLNNAATNLNGQLVATTNALATLAAENARMINDFNEAQVAIPSLKNQAETIAFQIGSLRGRLASKLSELEQRARDNVEERHKLPFWKKALGVLSVAADLVPVGQPTVGRIGAGLGLLAQVDPDHPLQSAEKLAPNAFGIMTNKNITVCFGTNAPPNTSTNTSGSNTNSSGTNTVKQAKQDRVKQLSECGKFLGAELKELAGVFKEAQVDDKELAAELEKLKASDTEFQGLTAELETLNGQKEQFAQQLAAALQVIGSLDSSLTENLISTHELEEKLATGFAALDHGALIHIREMERRAKDRLLQYQYFLAQSFQYRRLRPYNGNLQLTRLFDRFRVLVEAGNNHLLSEQEFNVLKGIFTDELREIIAQMLDNLNAPEVTLAQPFALTPGELDQLNRNGSVVVNLAQHGLLTLTRENIRIADWRTTRMGVQPVGGALGQSALVGVNYEHSGVSHLTSAGRQFLFRHYTAQTINPIVWHTIFDARNGGVANSELSPAQQSLLGFLLAGQTGLGADLLFFSEPAATADVLITKEVVTDNGIGLTITNLEFEVRLDFDSASSSRRELDVVVTNNLAPVIVVSRTDLNGRQDGQGDFTRVFAPFSQVTLQAPASFGEFVFDRWIVNGQAAATTSPLATITLASDTRAEPLFRRTSSQSFTLTPLAAPAGQIGFSFPTVPGARYTIEQTLRLTNPTWAPLETRTGDGSRIQFTRPISGNAAVFFRVRVE
jgi:hypothetical protein